MFISLEGIDSSGKKTQIDLLEKKLVEKGHKVERIDFPMYETPFGKLVAAYLRGELGKIEHVVPEASALLYALDRYQFKEELEKKIKTDTVVITNRYTQSNLAFQGAKLEGPEQDHFIKWIEDMETRLPQPSLVIFLDMPPQAAKKLGHDSRKYMEGKDTNYDIHEENSGYQEKVRQVYLRLALKKGWLVVNCAIKEGDEWKLRSPEEIHEKVWERVEKMLTWRSG